MARIARFALVAVALYALLRLALPHIEQRPATNAAPEPAGGSFASGVVQVASTVGAVTGSSGHEAPVTVYATVAVYPTPRAAADTVGCAEPGCRPSDYRPCHADEYSVIVGADGALSYYAPSMGAVPGASYCADAIFGIPSDAINAGDPYNTCAYDPNSCVTSRGESCASWDDECISGANANPARSCSDWTSDCSSTGSGRYDPAHDYYEGQSGGDPFPSGSTSNQCKREPWLEGC